MKKNERWKEEKRDEKQRENIDHRIVETEKKGKREAKENDENCNQDKREKGKENIPAFSKCIQRVVHTIRIPFLRLKTKTKTKTKERKKEIEQQTKRLEDRKKGSKREANHLLHVRSASKPFRFDEEEEKSLLESNIPSSVL